jgi:hypothetical protein
MAGATEEGVCRSAGYSDRLGQEIKEEEATFAAADWVINQQDAVWRSTMDEVLALYNTMDAVGVLRTNNEDHECLIGFESPPWGY